MVDRSRETRSSEGTADRNARAIRDLADEACARMYVAYRRGIDGEAVMAHVRECSSCAWIMFGEDAGGRSGAARPFATSRRTWMKTAAAAVIVLSLTAAGISLWSTITPKPSTPIHTGELNSLDEVFANAGPAAIIAMISGPSATDQGSRNALEWIARRRRSVLYSTLIAGCLDTRASVRTTAIRYCFHVPPQEFKVHQSQLDANVLAAVDPGDVAILKRLATTVQQS